MTWKIKVKAPQFNLAVRQEIRKIERGIMVELSQYMYDTLVQYIDSGNSAWPPLSQVTKWLKGSDTLLVNSGDFKNALQIQVEDQKALVGILVPRGAHGQDMEMIAKVIEGGATIPVSDKMRRWFAWKGYPLRKTTFAIVIPARPLFNPSMDLLEENVGNIVEPYFDSMVKAI